MFGWNVVIQRTVRLTIICLLLLISNSTPNKANKMNQSPKLPQKVASNNKVDIHRLYNAYRDRVKDGSEDLKRGTGLISENTAVAEEDDLDSLAKDVKTDMVDRSGKTSLIEKGNSKAAKKTQLTVNCDAPDDHNVGDLKCVPIQKSKDVEDEKISGKTLIKRNL